METGKKYAIGFTAVLLLAVGVRVGLIYRERNAPAKVANQVTPSYKTDKDQLVFLKKQHPDTLQDEKELVGKTLWVSAGGQMDFYPYAGHKVAYAKSAGTLLGAQPLMVKDAVEQVAPKSATFRIPGGDKQVLLVFTRPGDATEYAVPVGYREAGQYTFFTDEIFFYDDPHELYKHWGAETWKAVDEHRVALGMNERQVQLALGQVSKSVSEEVGNRMVVFDNGGHPLAVTFVKDRVTAFRPDQGF